MAQAEGVPGFLHLLRVGISVHRNHPGTHSAKTHPRATGPGICIAPSSGLPATLAESELGISPTHPTSPQGPSLAPELGLEWSPWTILQSVIEHN